MATLYVDHHPYDANPNQNVLQVCLSLGFDLPYFCWHPALGSVGACRQCAIKQFRDEDDTRGRLVMACMTPAADNTRISINDAQAKAFRASVIEWLMVNHPHDCPVCDEGGHCHLQDMTVMTGHTYRRYRFAKRTYRNQDLGPFINHEMNRCIQCYRCVRFYRDYAGGRDLNAFASRDRVYFGRHEDGVLESEFSGNLVEICPTGVFTDKTLKSHYTRKWDLQTAPSVCVHCSLGCNTLPGERYGEVREIVNRYNHQVNGYFLCDRGRFGYGFINSEQRLRQPLLRRRDQAPAAASKETALEQVASMFDQGARAIGIGSPRASLEANFALYTLVGPEHFYRGVSAPEHRLIIAMLDMLQHGPARTPSLHDVEQADAVLVLGEDLTQVAPILALAVRQAVRQQPIRTAEALDIARWNDAAVREAVQQQKGPLFIATPARTALDEVARQTYRAVPDDVARLGFAVAHALHAGAPGVADLAEETRGFAEAIARALADAKRPLIVSGASLGSEAVLQAAANVAWALCRSDRAAQLCFTAPECNSMGLGMLGGHDLDGAFQAVRDGAADTVIVLENDLYQQADAVSVGAFFDACKHVIVVDHTRHRTSEHAEVFLPAGTVAEADGTLVSNEGRAQRFFQVVAPAGDVQESWRWLRDIMETAGRYESSTWHSLDDVIAALAAAIPAFTAIPDVAPSADFRMAGQKIPRQPPRYSGRTAMTAHRSVYEPQPPADLDAPLAFSMEGYSGQPPASLIPFIWAPSWSSPQALNKFQSEVGGPLRGGDPGIRLIEPATEGKGAFFQAVPAAFVHRDEMQLLVPIHHIFGSEGLSMHSPAVAARAPEPYVGLSRDDAGALGIHAHEAVNLHLADATYRLPARIDLALPQGMIGLPAGLPGVPPVWAPVWASITKVA
jgi:NADH-quinone oxidoreductase subunit G